MQRLICLLLLGAALTAGPALSAVNGVPDTVAVVSPPLSSFTGSKDGCTPLNPCAVVTPVLGNAGLPAPEMPAQPNLPATPEGAPPANPPAPAAANPNCPPAGARGALARGGEGFRRFVRPGARNGGAESTHGFGGGVDPTAAPAGQAFRAGNFARGANGCPRPRSGQGRGDTGAQAGR